MRAHEKPSFSFSFNLGDELDVLNAHKNHRNIPEKSNETILIATWNLTNFGLQKRLVRHIELMARIISYFDLVAIQEVADDLKDFETLMRKLGDNYDAVFTDIAGNQERLGYIYDKTKVQPTGLIAELAMRGYERKRIVIEVEGESEEEEFDGFNRNPYIVTFRSGDFEFSAVNVHLYWSNFYLRRLETQALSKWAKKRVTKKYPPNNDIILLGDFNMPKLATNDKIFRELTANGLRVPKFDTELIGSNLAGDKHYDEVAFFPSRTNEDFTNRMGVFDFDKVLFNDLWDDHDRDQQKNFYKYIRYYLADHRPLWAEFKI